MRQPKRILLLLWTVITVLLIGGAVGGFLLVHKLDQLSSDNAELTSNVESLRNQLAEARTTPSPSPSISATPSASVTPSPAASATPASTKTPTPTSR